MINQHFLKMQMEMPGDWCELLAGEVLSEELP